MAIKDENSLLAEDVNQCLTNHQLIYSPSFDTNDFRITENIITNHLATSKLSDVIFKNYFPQNSLSEYHHFTDINAFQNIIEKKELWLFSIEKRFTEKEFTTFYCKCPKKSNSLKLDINV